MGWRNRFILNWETSKLFSGIVIQIIKEKKQLSPKMVAICTKYK